MNPRVKRTPKMMTTLLMPMQFPGGSVDRLAEALLELKGLTCSRSTRLIAQAVLPELFKTSCRMTGSLLY